MLKSLISRIVPVIKQEGKFCYQARVRFSLLVKVSGNDYRTFSQISNFCSGQKCAAAESTPDIFPNLYGNERSTLTEEDIKELADNDPNVEKFLRVLILEIDIFRQDGELVPNRITLDEWRELLGLKNRSSRLRYLKFLFKNEKSDENQRLKKAVKAKEREEFKKEKVISNHINYGFGGSTIFIRIYDTTMDAYLNKNLINAAMFSQPLVFDCSYDKHMTRIEAKNCAKQICMLFAENRNHINPFHLQFCNADPNSYVMQCLNKYFPQMYEPHYPFFVTEKSFSDLYPKEKLVYLTPHCRNDLIDYNHDDVYIVGAMVDKSNPQPLSLAKAKEQGLRMAKLPLERHLIWGSGATKNLTLNQMTSILLDMRHTGDWSKAFKHIPRRKVITDQELVNEARLKGMKQTNKSKWKGIGEVSLSSNIINRIKSKKNYGNDS